LGTFAASAAGFYMEISTHSVHNLKIQLFGGETFRDKNSALIKKYCYDGRVWYLNLLDFPEMQLWI
jgi:hypothetical protein